MSEADVELVRRLYPGAEVDMKALIADEARVVRMWKTFFCELETEAGTVWWLRDGKVNRVEAYQNHDRALRAAGLS